MQTIVVATDFSTDADNAMKYAAALAQKIKARLILFNSYQLPDDQLKTPFSKAEIDQHLDRNREFLAGIALKVSGRYKIRVDFWTNLTYVAEGLEELVQRSNAQLVVMGMWKNAQEDSLFGNTTTFVMQEAKYPVLVVPEEARFKGLDKILFSYDQKKRITVKTLKLLKFFASCFDSQLQVFHLNQMLEASGNSMKLLKRPLEQLLKGVEHDYRNMEGPHILEGIEIGLREFEADLLVMLPHKPDFMDSFFYESITREMALRTKVPLLALPQE